MKIKRGDIFVIHSHQNGDYVFKCTWKSKHKYRVKMWCYKEGFVKYRCLVLKGKIKEHIEIVPKLKAELLYGR